MDFTEWSTTWIEDAGTKRDGQTQADRQMEFNMTYETLALVELLEIILMVLSL